MQNEQDTILITGATDGIGLELARHYAARGSRLVLVGRREHGPDVPGKFHYCRANLAREESAAQIREYLDAAGIERLHAVIHNAGVGYYGRFAQQPPASIRELVAVNLTAPIALTHALLPLLAHPHGQLAFISSAVSTLPGPDYAVYTATKAALDGFARSLRIELDGQVRVQVIHPGATRTGMHAKMGLSRDVMDWGKFTPADRVAAWIARAMDRKRPFAAIGISSLALQVAGRKFGWLLDPLLRHRRDLNIESRPAAEPLHCVITGAADGIGKALAWRFGRAGYTITGVDVDAARAAVTQRELQASGIPITFIHADLAESAGVAAALAALAAGPAVDIFVHNAGISAVGRFDRIPIKSQERVVAINFLAPLQLTAGLLRQNLFQPGGTWIFLSSLSHFMSYPGAAVYAASKDGIASFARSLYASGEAAAQVLTVFPGPTRTAHARRYSPDNNRESSRMVPDVLAAEIFRAARRGQRRLVPGMANRLLAGASQLVPALFEWGMKQSILRKLGDDVMV